MTVSVKPPAAFAKRKLSAKQLQQPNEQTGLQGEQQAVDYLISKNFTIVDQNVVTRFGEVDIIAIDQSQQELVFVEVKNRNSRNFGEPGQEISWKKRRNFHQSALAYLAKKPSPLAFRFDLISIRQGTIHHIEDCFS